MMKKTLVLLSSVLAGALLVGGAFATYITIQDNADPIGITTTPGYLEPEGTLTLDWGEHEQAIVDGSKLDGLLPGQPQKAGVLVLKAEYDENLLQNSYEGTLAVNFIDKNQGERADKFIDFLNVRIYEDVIDEVGEAEPVGQALLGKAENLTLEGNKAGLPYTVFIELDATAASILDNIQEDEVQITFDWGKYVEPAPAPEPIPEAPRLVIAPLANWENKQYVALVDNPDDENEVMKQGLVLAEGDLFYIELGDDQYLHYSNLENAGAAANFEADGTADNNVKVKTAGTYDLYAAIGKLYIGLSGGDEPVVSGAKIGIGPAGNWDSVKYVALTPNPDNEGELMAEGVELGENDIFYIDFGDGEHYLHYPELEEAGAAANFGDNNDSDHNLKVVVAGTYDIYATTAKIYISLSEAQ